MTVILQIHDVPRDGHDHLAGRAEMRGLPLQDFLLAVVTREAKVAPDFDPFFGTEHLRIEIPPELDPVAIIREGREHGAEADRAEYGW